MPQQSHHKGREREQGKRGPGAEREGKGRGKQSGAWRAGEEGRRWPREKPNKTNNTPKHRARKHRSQQGEKETRRPGLEHPGARGTTARAPGNPERRAQDQRQGGGEKGRRSTGAQASAEEATGQWDARRIVDTANRVGQKGQQTGSSIVVR